MSDVDFRLDISKSCSILVHGGTPACDMSCRSFALFVQFRRRRLELLSKQLLLCCHHALGLFGRCFSLGLSCRSAFTVCDVNPAELTSAAAGETFDEERQNFLGTCTHGFRPPFELL